MRALKQRDLVRAEKLGVASLSKPGPAALANVCLGRVYAAQARVEEARRSFHAALVASPDNVDALVGLAVVERDAGHLEDARRLAGRAYDLSPSSPAVTNLLDSLR